MTEHNHHSSPAGPLAGVRVIEYAVFHAGPGSGAILGDLGAAVIKVESKNGDPERAWTQVGGLDISVPSGESVMHEISNRSKRGLWLDITRPEGRQVLDRLVSGADVFLTNLRQSTIRQLALDYPSIRALKPDIIHASVSGYGPEGPAADTGAFDPMGQARSGMMYLHDPQNPSLIHLAVLDQATAIAASHAVLAALFSRERTGRGQAVHGSLFGTAIWLLYANMVTMGLLGFNPSFPWERFRNSPLRNSYRCADGRWIIGVHHPERKYWAPFCRATGQEALMDDPRYADAAARAPHHRELVAHFDGILATRPCDEWIRIFTEHHLMFSPVQTIREVMEDPQALANRYVVEYDHPDHGRVKLPGYPAHFSDTAAGIRRPAPGLGQHTDEVLGEAGFGSEEIQRLREMGVVK